MKDIIKKMIDFDLELAKDELSIKERRNNGES